jgi:hypothetical protein
MAVAAHLRATTLTINPHNQNLETLQNILRQILGRAGCAACGRIAVWRFDFLGDPPVELAKEGIISMHEVAH